jgi:hypothetical protein
VANEWSWINAWKKKRNEYEGRIEKKKKRIDNEEKILWADKNVDAKRILDALTFWIDQMH